MFQKRAIFGFFKETKTVKFTVFPSGKPHLRKEAAAKEGENFLDVMYDNDLVDSGVFGYCDK